MQSFVSAPGLHATALRDPANLGGPFVNLDAAQVSAVRELLRTYVYAMGQEPWLTFLTAVRYSPSSKPIFESDPIERGVS